MNQNIVKDIEEIVDQYVISHKGNLQCRCISGARGHLVAKLERLFRDKVLKPKKFRPHFKI